MDVTLHGTSNPWPHQTLKISNIISYVLRLGFVPDIVLNFRTTFVNRKGEVVSISSSIALHYLKGWFVVDLLAALPFDLLYASDVYNREVSTLGCMVNVNTTMTGDSTLGSNDYKITFTSTNTKLHLTLSNEYQFHVTNPLNSEQTALFRVI